MLKNIVYILTLILLSLTFSFSQNITISGIIKERIDKFDKRGNIKKNDFDIQDINNVWITVSTQQKTILSKTTKTDGSYSVSFPASGNIYFIKFSKSGYIPKISELDLKQLSLQEYLELEDWDFGLRKNIKNLSNKVINKPFERYVFDSKNGELVYDNNYSLEYEIEEGETVFAQLEDNKKDADIVINNNDDSSVKIINNAKAQAKQILSKAKSDRDAILNKADQDSKILAEEYLKGKKKQADLEYKQIVESIQRKERKRIYSSIKDSILALALETTGTKKSAKSNQVKQITSKENLESKKIVLYARRQQLEIDRLKAITKEDSLIIQLREQEIASAESDIKVYESEMQATKAQLEAEHKELLLKKVENENQRNIIIIGLLLLFLVLGGAIFIYKNLKEKQKTADLLQNRNEVIAQKSESILSSIKYAKKIQESILPHQTLWEKNLLDSFILYMPKDIVSGDFYWMHKISKDEVMFAAVDCTGHGVPGAFMSIVGYHSLHRAINEFGLKKPSEVLDSMQKSVNSVLRQGFGGQIVKDGMDIALCSYNSKTKVIQYAGGYNPLWILRDKEMIETKATKQAVGMFTGDLHPFENHEIQLQNGDSIYIFSDGYADQFGGPNGKKIMSKGLKNILISNGHLELNKQKVVLKKFFYEWMNEGDDDQVDDVCIIGFKI